MNDPEFKSKIPFQNTSGEDDTERETAAQGKAMTHADWIAFTYGKRPRK